MLVCRYVHLAANLVFQLFVGIPLEMVHKWWRILLIYILGVLAGEEGGLQRDINLRSP